MRILIIEDEKSLREDVVDYFCNEIANINIAITAIEEDITTIQGDITEN